MEPGPPALGMQSLSHWTTREVPALALTALPMAVWMPSAPPECSQDCGAYYQALPILGEGRAFWVTVSSHSWRRECLFPIRMEITPSFMTETLFFLFHKYTNERHCTDYSCIPASPGFCRAPGWRSRSGEVKSSDCPPIRGLEKPLKILSLLLTCLTLRAFPHSFSLWQRCTQSH